MKKIVLAAINAKYIHANLAVYSLKSYAQARARKEKVSIEIAEYTINQQEDLILEDLYKRQPDILCFSCYIWNIRMIGTLLPEIKKICQNTEIWLGGPEVSYDAVQILETFPQIRGVMKGEGEETFAVLTSQWGQNEEANLENTEGITYRDKMGTIRENPWRQPVDMDRIPFVYRDMTDFEHKIIYYESSRGCPFSCSYCLSSIDKRLRFRSLDLVKKELQFFLDRKIPQVKFVDRTFNCRHDHAMAIWKYLTEHDNGVTNFHFEISADLLTEEEIRLIRSMRPGLIQLEIGVQSINPDTIRAIRRTTDLEKLSYAVKKVREKRNVHQHLDLIAGLPFEDLNSFARSYDWIYRLKPDQLQLGFLKVLKGSHMAVMQKEYGLLHKDTPPYEVLSTRWLSYRDTLVLKGVEEMTEVYYNSGQFKKALALLEEQGVSPFALYRTLAEYYEAKHLHFLSHSRASRYEILLAFVKETYPEAAEKMKECLIYDYYLRENAKSRPAFAGEDKTDKSWVRAFYEKEAEQPFYLAGYENYDKNQLRRMTHVEYFPLAGIYVVFDYLNRDPLSHDGQGILVEKEDEKDYNENHVRKGRCKDEF